MKSVLTTVALAAGLLIQAEPAFAAGSVIETTIVKLKAGPNDMGVDGYLFATFSEVGSFGMCGTDSLRRLVLGVDMRTAHGQAVATILHKAQDQSYPVQVEWSDNRNNWIGANQCKIVSITIQYE